MRASPRASSSSQNLWKTLWKTLGDRVPPRDFADDRASCTSMVRAAATFYLNGARGGTSAIDLLC
jgi:hypothetical protein